MNNIHVSGKRKSAIARATIKQGKGIIRINNKMLDVYEPKIARMKIMEPMMLAGDSTKKIDVSIKVSGGGIASQAEAARLAVAKALAKFDNSLEKTFLNYDRHLLVADVRRKETHKPNRHGKARSKTQKSYR